MKQFRTLCTLSKNSVFNPTNCVTRRQDPGPPTAVRRLSPAGRGGRFPVRPRGMLGRNGHSAERREPAPSGDIGEGEIPLLPGAVTLGGCSGSHGPGLEPRGDSGEQECFHSAQVRRPMLWGRFGAVSAALSFQETAY